MLEMRTLAVLLLASLATFGSAQDKCVFKFEAAPPKGTTCASLKDITAMDKDLTDIKATKMASEIAPAMKKLKDAVKKRVQVEKILAEMTAKVKKMEDNMKKLDNPGAAAAAKPAAGNTGATGGAKPGAAAGAKPGGAAAGAKPGAAKPGAKPATPPKPADPGDDKDCAGLKLKDNSKKTGLASIKPPGQSAAMQVWCNMDIGQEPRGWVVILRRENGSLDFNKKFADYEKGFGTPSSPNDYWIGLQNLQKITAQDEWQLYVSLTDHDNKEAFAKYKKFKVSGADYKLTIEGFDILSTAGDGLTDFNFNSLPCTNHNYISYTSLTIVFPLLTQDSNGVGFSANDKDNDGSKTSECGKQYQSGWWFNQFCPNPANLNGKYHKKGDPFDSRGIFWREWRQNKNLKKAVMMLQRKRGAKPASG
ncbi:fibrinogen-like protein 1 [Branchiostoma floridae]|uniref:Fibrinogen-like protein 1 n=1 Tax=Branchiostoma floridae TaxID=7739 RepID=A0A9J7MIT1_BRAFL|nr:fibrinogen-like protein 1 [Branchiostoma floridae]